MLFLSSLAEFIAPDRRQSKTLILSMNVDQKSLETEFFIAICRPTGDKWQSKTLFLAIFDGPLLIDKSVLIAPMYIDYHLDCKNQLEKKL